MLETVNSIFDLSYTDNCHLFPGGFVISEPGYDTTFRMTRQEMFKNEDFHKLCRLLAGARIDAHIQYK